MRCAKLAKDRGIGGPLIGPTAYFMKSPPVQFSDEAAREMVEEFAAGETPLEVVDRPQGADVHADQPTRAGLAGDQPAWPPDSRTSRARNR